MPKTQKKKKQTTKKSKSTKQWTIKTVQLDNKSRKGTYTYIRPNTKNARGKYYKKDRDWETFPFFPR